MSEKSECREKYFINENKNTGAIYASITYLIK
jgi:hypothetical protein